MAAPRSAWGIDIGNRALKAVKVVRGTDGFQIEDIAVIEHEHILSSAGDNKESLIQAALQTFVQQHVTKRSAIGIGVSGQASFARFIKLPPVEARKIPEIVRFEAIQQIPFPLDDVEWSYQLFQDESSPDVEVGIFAMRKDLVNKHIEFFEHSHIDVHVVQMNPLALYNAMYADERLKGTTMIIDIGAENTDLIIAEGESVWLRSIPIGGNQFTESLTKSFKLRFDKAEELKRNAATSKYARQILQAMRPVFADLVSEIQRSIGFYSSVHRDSRIQRVLALGGTFRLPGLQKYLQQNLQLEVHRVDRIGAGAPEEARLAATFNENLLSIVPAYGLALQALGAGKITSTLLPQTIQRERMWRDKTKWFAAAAVIVLAGVGLKFGRIMYDSKRYDEAQANFGPQIARVEQIATRLDNEWSRIETLGGPDRILIQNIQSIEQGRAVWPGLLQDITSAMPDPGPDVRSGNPDLIKKVVRNKRKVVRIEQLASHYEPNMTRLMKNDAEFRSMATSLLSETGAAVSTPTPQFGVPAPVPEEGAAPVAPERGFVVAIRCTTPYGDVSEFADMLPAAIKRENAKTASAAYRITRVDVSAASKLQPPANRPNNLRRPVVAPIRRSGELAPPPPPPPSMLGMSGAGRVPGAPAADVVDTFLDPVTGETLKDDWQITLLVAVVLDPKPVAPTAPAGGAEASAQAVAR